MFSMNSSNFLCSGLVRARGTLFRLLTSMSEVVVVVTVMLSARKGLGRLLCERLGGFGLLGCKSAPRGLRGVMRVLFWRVTRVQR